jgi:hypothetical protein
MFDDLPSADDNQSTAVSQYYWERLGRMTPAERLGRCLSLCNATREFVLSGIRSRHPECLVGENQKAELRRLYAEHTFGVEFAAQHCPKPDSEPRKGEKST